MSVPKPSKTKAPTDPLPATKKLSQEKRKSSSEEVPQKSQKPKHPRDLRLVKRGVIGEEPAAIRELVRMHEPHMRRVLTKMLKGRDAVDDTLQDLWIKLITRKGMRGYDGNKKLSAYLNKAAFNAGINVLKKGETAKRALQQETHSKRGLAQQRLTRHMPDRIFRDMRIREEVDALVERLPEQQRKVFDLKVGQGLETHQVAAELGLDNGTVRFHLHSARKTLKAALREQGITLRHPDPSIKHKPGKREN